jgi:mono/diheme cytochrome c family protein
MLRKWYIELPLVLLAIVIAVMWVWNIDSDPSSFSPPGEEVTTPSTNTNTTVSKESAVIAEGKGLFRSNCASCHNPVAEGTGPPLAGVAERWDEAGPYKGKEGSQRLKLWIRNWHEAVDAGYPYALQMANSRATEMNIFSNLSDEQIDKILLYLNSPPRVTIMPTASLR